MVLWGNMVFHVLGTTAIGYLPKGIPTISPFETGGLVV